MIKLYKKDSKGNIRFLEIEAKEGTIIQTSGIIGTENPVTNISQCEAKNIGKSNETSLEEQAVLEVESKVREKLRLGYFENKESAELLGGKDFLLPMLAKDAKKMMDKIKYPCYIQPKLDGMRVLAIKKNGKTTLISRRGKEITTLNHIVEQLNDSEIPDNIYDGEAYSLELGSFQEQMKAIKKNIKGITEKINFNIYDVVLDKPFADRYKLICNIFS